MGVVIFGAMTLGLVGLIGVFHAVAISTSVQLQPTVAYPQPTVPSYPPRSLTEMPQRFAPVTVPRFTPTATPQFPAYPPIMREHMYEQHDGESRHH